MTRGSIERAVWDPFLSWTGDWLDIRIRRSFYVYGADIISSQGAGQGPVGAHAGAEHPQFVWRASPQAWARTS